MSGIRSFVSDFLFVMGDARRQIPAIFGLFLFAALLDLCGLGLVLPLITALTVSGTQLTGMPLLFDLKWLAAAVVLVYVARAAVAYWVQKTILRFSEGQRGLMMMRLLDAYLRKPYEFHLQRNSAVLVNTTLNLTWGYATGVLSASLRLVTDLVTFAVILGFLAWANWQVVAVVAVVLLLVLAVYNRLSKGLITRSGETVAVSQANAIRVLNHTLGALREVRILGTEAHALREMQLQSDRLAQAGAISGAVQAMPRYLVETSVIALLSALAFLVQLGAISGPELIPTLGLFAIAAVRLMPGTTSVVGALNSLRGNRYALRQLAQDLRIAEGDLEVRQSVAPVQSTPTHFRNFRIIELAGVTYSYPAVSKPALHDFTLTIHAGQAIGIIGRTGAGKSTLADIILGLIKPQGGEIRVDGKDIHEDVRAWMKQLAYIPQTVYIKDDTLRANVAFGVPDDQIDPARLVDAIAASQLEEVVRQLPNGLDTMLGERGVRLSGGQRQRVALARAFYHDRQLIVMDEATAALDTETEREVIRAISDLHGQKTLIIIAHRVSTLKGCDHVHRFDGGRLVESLCYEDIVDREARISGQGQHTVQAKVGM